jgi:hypothetical protein
METQAKLLNKDYLETRLRDLSVIRKKEFSFKIHESDRALSRTLYIEFWKNEALKLLKSKKAYAFEKFEKFIKGDLIITA